MPQRTFCRTSDRTLRLERIEPDENRRRYYEMTSDSACEANEVLGRSLFDASARPANETDDAAEALPVTLTRRARSLREPPHNWGRIGRPGRERVELHPSLAEAEMALDRPRLLRKPSLGWRRAKARRGYATVGQGA